ncbi:glycosyltransferase family 4 protein [Gorillibacterium sp. sgz500922]|uniref:glycosyltransferase family 4 protein n=1 Tax=Gorillibacterium sp. sgz500922 TaxID=3446694 RepID=UPI003F66A27F
MKILFTFYNPSGGMETLNRIRSKALNQAGHECHLLYTVDGKGRRNIKGIRTFVIGNDSGIRGLIERERYDLVVVCTDVHLLEKVGASDFDGKLIYEVQGLGTLETAKTILASFAGRIRAYADGLLYPDTNHLKELMSSMFADIPQFCFDDPLDTEHFGYEAYPPKPYPILGWVGRLEKNKNWREFLQIGAGLLRHYPQLYLWMFDDDTLSEPGEKDAFEQMIRELSLQGRLIRHSNTPHELMADYFSLIGDSGGLLCSTSIMEGFGYAVAEAMLCLCPVLATDSDGIRRMLRHNVTGKFYERGDIGKAVGEARELMQNRRLRTNIVNAAEKRIREQFSASRYVKNFARLLLWARESASPPRRLTVDSQEIRSCGSNLSASSHV